MIELVDFSPDHAGLIQLQAAQRLELGGAVAIPPRHAEKLWRSGPALSALRDGVPVAAAGLTEIHSHYATAWALLSDGLGAAMVPITRAIRSVLDSGAYRRIDTTVPSGFEQGHRWADMLGFTYGHRLRAWGSDGTDYDLYERILTDGR